MSVEIKNLTMKFGAFTALTNINLEIKQGEFFSILGPSGCGKTTLLKVLSGFLEQSAGKVIICNKDMCNIEANKRPTSLIFQNLALFPQMSIKENVAFGLRVKKVSNEIIDKKVKELLKMVSLEKYENSMVSELSGGQLQRVAIIRALAVEPKVLLLDEPLSSLDLKLRQHMRKELRDLQHLTGITFIYITHDQGEALSMSNRVAVMSNGKVEQISSPEDLYNNPKTSFVASFVGENNEFDGTILEQTKKTIIVDTLYGKVIVKNRGNLIKGKKVKLFIRPERFSVVSIKTKTNKKRDNSFILDLKTSTFEGSILNIYLKRKKNDLIQTDILIHKKNNEDKFTISKSKLEVFFDDHDVILLGASDE